MSTVHLSVTLQQTQFEKIAFHRREIAWHKKQLEPLERDVRDLLIAGAEWERGKFSPKVVWTSRHQVAWKDVVVEKLGEAFVLDTLASSKVIHIPRLELIEHPPLPLFPEGLEPDA